MSHPHIRAQKAPLPPVRIKLVFWIVSGGMFLALVSVLAWVNFRESKYWETHSSADGAVSETRIVVDHIRDSNYGGRIFYRLEAHVAFRAEGKDEDRWLVASETDQSQAMLAAKVAKSPHRCEVYWVTGHPENARCSFE